MAWKVRGAALERPEGIAVRQTNGRRTRIRVMLYGHEGYIYLRPDSIEPLANLMDDLDNAIVDGEFDAGRPNQQEV